MANQIPPTFDAEVFNCPYCDVHAKQNWFKVVGNGVHGGSSFHLADRWRISRCDKCDEPTIWLAQKVLFPQGFSGPQLNEDLTQDIRTISTKQEKSL